MENTRNKIGSEKITNIDDKLKRMQEIAGIKTNLNENTESTLSTILFEMVSPSNKEYAIVQEKKYIYLKEKINGTYTHIGGVQNLKEHSYKTYADALKNLNLMIKEENVITPNAENIDLLKKK